MNISRFLSATASATLIVLAATSCAGTSSPGNTSGPGQTKLPEQTASVLMNYFAQAEQGGYWDAMENQYAEGAGVTLDVRQGGPGIQTIPQVAAGQTDFGISNADEILIARKNGLPIVAVASAYDKNLFAMLSHKEMGITSFEELNTHQVARRPAPYFEYLKARFELDDIEEINFTGSMADFKRNKNLIQQGFLTGDVFRAQQEGIDINVLSVAEDGGYNPYGLVLFTTESLVEDNPDLVRAVVAATTQGWQNFTADPGDAKSAIFAANRDADEATFDFSAKTIIEGDYLGDPIGHMQDERWTVLRDQLVSIGQLPAGFDTEAAFTNDFLP